MQKKSFILSKHSAIQEETLDIFQYRYFKTFITYVLPSHALTEEG
jgi:hypothetical protein